MRKYRCSVKATYGVIYLFKLFLLLSCKHFIVSDYQRWSPRGRPQEQILKSLALKPHVL